MLCHSHVRSVFMASITPVLRNLSGGLLINPLREHKPTVNYIFDNNFPDLSRQDNITQMNELVNEFISTKEEKRLKQLVHDMVNLSNSFQDELLWRRPVMKVLIPFIADILYENIPAIADGSIEPMSDDDVIQALHEFTSMAASSVET